MRLGDGKSKKTKKKLLYYPNPKQAPTLVAIMNLPEKEDSIFHQMRIGDYVDLTKEEAHKLGGDFYYEGRYKMVEDTKKLNLYADRVRSGCSSDNAFVDV
jgi:hypothetical protein